MNIRTEYQYNKDKDETTIYIWNGFQLIETRQIPENIDWRRKKKITKEIKNEYKDKA